MHTALNSLAIDYVAETALEVNDDAGLEALSILLEKFASRPGFVTQPERLDAARATIRNRRAAIAV
jgi:hypothetical protein